MKLRFKYTISGTVHYFEIVPRETGQTINFNNLGAMYTHVTGGYIGRNDGLYENLIAFSSAVQNLTGFDKAVNSWELRVNNMMYDHSVPLSDLTKNDGQMMYFDSSSGTMKMTAFVRTEYIEGVATPVFYIGGIFNVSPTGSAPFYGSASNSNGVYTTLPETIPRIDFAHFVCDDNGENIDCLLVTILKNPEALLTANQAYIFDMRLFSGSSPKPTTDGNTTTPYGRTGTYNFTSDQMVDVPPTGYSFVNRWAHGLTLYHINDLQAEAIFAEFWGNETLWQMFLNSTVKQIQGVLCMHKVPVPVSSGSSTRALSIFGKRVARGELLEQLPLVNLQIVQYPENPQWVSIEEIYGDYFDYAGQTRFSVYLPFVGTVPIDVNKIMGGAIKTIYHIDLLTGNLIARVYGRNAMGNGAEVLLYQGSGNCALHIPYIGNDQGGMKLLGALAGVATAGLATVATGGAGAAPALAAISGTAGYALAPHNASVNNIPTEASPLSYPYVCYIMEYPERLLTELQGTQTGFATASGGANTTVSNYSGYTQGFLHADIVGATEAEKAEIESAFQAGVIL